MAPQMLQGTGLALGSHGVIITGPSGSGKTLLALDLIDHAHGRGQQAALVADDGLLLERDQNGLVMRTPQTIAGLVELRGRGLMALPHIALSRVDLWVELVDALERMPEPAAFRGTLCGHELARCPVPRRGVVDPVHQRLLVQAALRALT